MKKLTLTVIYLSLFLAISCQARDITVDDDGPADFNNIQAAINDANNGDTVIVADGIYTGSGNRDIDFGGKAITVRSENGPTNCIIDCQELGQGFNFHSGEGPDSVVCGFTITRGYAWCGAGIYCYFDSSPKIINCIFRDNTAEGAGGGLFHMSYLDKSSPQLINCTFHNNLAGNYGGAVGAYGCDSFDSVTLRNCIVWGNTPEGLYGSNCDPNGEYCLFCYPVSIAAYFSVLQGTSQSGENNIVADPCFADPDANDFHLKSQAGRWDPNQQTWVIDANTSLCIDAGNPGCPLGDEPNDVNNIRINMGAYGGTAEASKSPANWRSIADLTNDRAVDINDLGVFVKYWPDTGQCIPSDLDRNQSVNFVDYAVFAQQWLGTLAAEPGIEYEISPCDMGLSATMQSAQTRFTVTVEGRYIHFEDTMTANCCPDELELQMVIEGNLITINEIEYLSMPCTCICPYPVTATLGPFNPGTYTLEVYEDYGGFIGSTIVYIE